MPVTGSRAILYGLTAGSVAGLLSFIQAVPVWPLIVAFLITGAWLRRAWPLVAVASLGWSVYWLDYHIDHRWTTDSGRETLHVEGKVSGLPEHHEDYTRFLFEPDSPQSGGPQPTRVLAYWYRDRPMIKPGQRWLFELRVKPPWGRVNFHGDDRERWLYSQRIGGLATVVSGKLLAESGAPFSWHELRRRIRVHINRLATDYRAGSILLALAIADRSQMAGADRDLLTATGTSHLLAISGLHVGLAAFGGFWLARLLLGGLIQVLQRSSAMRRFKRSRWQQSLIFHPFLPAILCSLSAAFAYSALAGFGVSTQRALIMLVTGLLAVALGMRSHPWQTYVLAFTAVMLIDPLAPLSAGFWFSFAAVAALLAGFSFTRQNAGNHWLSLGRAQAAIMAIMLPLSLLWFQTFSLVGFLANLAAIPWVSLAIVPSLLLGILVLPMSDGLSTGLITLAAWATMALLWGLERLSGLPIPPVTLTKPGWISVGLAVTGGFFLLSPRAGQLRWPGLVCMVPLLLPVRTPDDAALQIDVLDVGQGTAALIRSPRHLLLYDSGPGNGDDFDLVDRVIRPAIRATGRSAPDVVIISHADLDHAGGLRSLIHEFPTSRYYASLPDRDAHQVAEQNDAIVVSPHPYVHPCNSVQQLSPFDPQVGGVSGNNRDFVIQVLHPSPFLAYSGNDSSCVISLAWKGFSMLLAGDISSAVEERLVGLGLSAHNFLLVPHHGSRSSSSQTFLDHANPDIAVATAGLGNRYGFPRAEIIERYRRSGAKFMSTGRCGGIRLRVVEGEIQIESARRARPAPWRWAAAETCP